MYRGSPYKTIKLNFQKEISEAKKGVAQYIQSIKEKKQKKKKTKKTSKEKNIPIQQGYYPRNSSPLK